MAKKTSLPRTVLKSYTFRGTDKVIRPGDSVLIKPLETKEPHYVGRVEKLGRNNLSHVDVFIRWYYRPEDVHCGRMSFNGRKELFLSDHYDWQSVHTIDGMCTVHQWEDYCKLEAVGVDDYFWRFEYKPSTGDFIPDTVAVYCNCEMPYNPDDFMVQCGDCEDWFHPSCIGITIEEAVELEKFLCSECASNKDAKCSSNSLAASPDDKDKVRSARMSSSLSLA